MAFEGCQACRDVGLAAGKGSNEFSKNSPSSCHPQTAQFPTSSKIPGRWKIESWWRGRPMSTQSSYLGWQPGTKPVEAQRSLENDISFQSAEFSLQIPCTVLFWSVRRWWAWPMLGQECPVFRSFCGLSELGGGGGGFPLLWNGSLQSPQLLDKEHTFLLKLSQFLTPPHTHTLLSNLLHKNQVPHQQIKILLEAQQSSLGLALLACEHQQAKLTVSTLTHSEVSRITFFCLWVCIST